MKMENIILWESHPVFFWGIGNCLLATYMERLPGNLFGGLALCTVIGYLIKYVCDHVSVLEKTFGLALVAFFPAFLVYFHLITGQRC